MVTLDQVQASNAQVAKAYPGGLVAVFAGATSGIGEIALRNFVQHTTKPRVYVIGRSQEACERLDKDLRSLNPGGDYIFIRSDVSLLRNVDDVCKTIKAKETYINVLFMSQGTLKLNTNTEEGINYLIALTYFGRLRFAANLLPLLQKASGLRRIVSAFAGAKEGHLYQDAWKQGQEDKVPMSGARGHAVSMMTLGLEMLAKRSPDVSFIHDFPGSVATNLIRQESGTLMQVMKYVFKFVGALGLSGKFTPTEEVGERHTFYCTSAKFPPAKGQGASAGVDLPTGVSVAKGVDDQIGSGTYSVDGQSESADANVMKLLAEYRRDGTAEKLWAYTESEWKRVTGTTSI
ncbi:hypothetical protein N0V93_002610 [Gnomoniopsis smithogilvyi]|uniref:Uncharacterized protein n=1 Tax=Gnomoniopsis smithogilvyi TaxID=1191159 RepID=A0A9W9CXT9_9PEZI|nr:hypothetical protein N0V93_002610 [Gnomoniopsis smithogilvyi]